MKCRLCLYECTGQNAIELFNNDEETNWTKLIVKYLYLEIKQDDPYSTLVCKTCLQHLENFHKFYQHVEQRQRMLENEFKWVVENMPTENHADEIGEPLLDIKYLIPEEGTIENPLSPVKSTATDNVDKESTNEETEVLVENPILISNISTKYPKKVKQNQRTQNCLESKKHATEQKNKKGSSTPEVTIEEINIEGSPIDNEEVKRKRQIQAAEIEKIKDELISQHIQLKCEFCGTLMDTFKNLKIHFRKKHAADGFITCCGKRFRLRRLLIDHIQVHLNPEHLKCDICNKILKSRERLKLHKATKHSDKQLLKHACALCHKRFACSSNLNAHMLVHSKERNHICTICSKGFKSEKFLKAHMQSHLETKPFVCDTCGREYRTKLSFERHVAEHEGRLAGPTDQCPTCGKWFTFDGLQRHVRSHNLEDVECKLCGKVLKSKNALRGHMDYSHRRQQTLTCTFCEKTFKRPSVFKEHIAMHTGQKDYNCPHCPREFRSKANMYAHIKKVHIEEWAERQLERFKGPNVQPQNSDEALIK